MEQPVELSVVVPAFNEGDVVEELILDLGRELPALSRAFEVIVVDDASSDDTPAILARLAGERSWLDVRRNPANAGHGASVLRGLSAARGRWILQSDSDGQFVVAEAGRLWAEREQADLVLGVRARRRDPRHRLLLTRVVRLTTSLLAGRTLVDVNTPFRLVRRDVLLDLRPSIPAGTLAPNVLVTLGAAIRGWRVVEVPVTHLPRERGPSTLRSLRLVRFSLRGLVQLVRYRVRLRRTAARAPVAVEP
jgi:glycosyltransferase involved in cell wall biosynthesis